MVWEGKDAVKTGRVMLGATNPLASSPGTSASPPLFPVWLLSLTRGVLRPQSVVTTPSTSAATSATAPVRREIVNAGIWR